MQAICLLTELKCQIFFLLLDGAWDLLKMAGQMVVGSFKSKTTHMGAAHADDLLYLFGMPFDFLPDFLLPQSKQDLKLRRLMVDLWANFAATHKVLLIAKMI